MADTQRTAQELADECKRLAEAWAEARVALHTKEQRGLVTAALSASMRLHAAIDRLAALASQAEPALPRGFLADVMTAAGLVRHGKQCRALSDRLVQGCASIRSAPPAPAQAEPAHATKDQYAQLAIHSDTASNGQQRNVVGPLEMGRQVGDGAHPAEGDSRVEGTKPLSQRMVAHFVGMDEYGPVLEWCRHWTEFPIGTKLYTTPPAPAQAEQSDTCTACGGSGERETYIRDAFQQDGYTATVTCGKCGGTGEAAQSEGRDAALSEDERAEFVAAIVNYGTEFATPLFAVVESIERAVIAKLAAKEQS